MIEHIEALQNIKEIILFESTLRQLIAVFWLIFYYFQIKDRYLRRYL